MTRVVPDSLLAQQAGPRGEHRYIKFIELFHPTVARRVRIVDDIEHSYLWNPDPLEANLEWIAIPFNGGLFGDTDQPPKAKIITANVDGRFSAMLNKIQSEIHVALYVLSSEDFDLTVAPRMPIGTPTIISTMKRVRAVRARHESLSVELELRSFDLSNEPWPRNRATKDVLPVFYRE